MRNIILVLICLSMALIGNSAAECTHYTVFPGQHVQVEAKTTPGTGLEHKWSTTSTGLMEAGVAWTDPKTAILKFDVPDDAAAGTKYVFKDYVKNPIGTNCNVEKCVDFTVVKCCKDYGPFCVGDSNTFCWYDCYATTPTILHWSSMTVNWYYNKNTASGNPDATTPCVTPNFAVSPWTQPTPSTPAPNYMTMQITQTLGGHYTDKVLYTCTDHFSILASPTINSIDAVQFYTRCAMPSGMALIYLWCLAIHLILL